MVIASVLRPPAFGQKLVSFNAIEAKKITGVIDVITIGEKVREFKNSGKRSWTFQISDSDKVVVIAKNTWAAIKGKKALSAEWKTDAKAESTVEHDRILTNILDGNKLNAYYFAHPSM